MARPSLKIEKTEAILQAYEHCVATYGVEGATLQKVAETAEMARPLLRHYVGNQADLLSQCLERYMVRQQEQLTWFGSVDSVTTLLDGLFDTTPISDEISNDVLIASAFILAAPLHPTIKVAMQNWFRDLQTAFNDTLTRLYPAADSDSIHVVVTGIIGIYFNLFAMQSIDDSPTFAKQSQQAARQLVANLEYGHE